MIFWKRSIQRLLSCSLPLAIVCTFFFASVTQGLAQEDSSSSAPDLVENDINLPSSNTMVDTTQEQASFLLVSAAEWFDNFFSDSRFENEENISRAKLRLHIDYSEEEGFDFSPSVRWRIHLPNLSKRLNLLLFAADDEQLAADQEIPGSDPAEESFRDNFAAALQYFIETTDKYNISTTFGGSYDYLYGGMRFRYFQDFGSWQGRLVERVRYYTDDGWENRFTVDLERQISDKWVFRTSGIVYWLESDDNVQHVLSQQLYQHISNTKAFSYELQNVFQTDPDYDLSNTIVRVRYRQQFYRDWLLFEVAPRVSFPKDNDREAEFAIAFTIEAIFGNLNNRKLLNIFQF